jgi:hypothetical protein
MLLFLLQDSFRDRPAPRLARPEAKVRDYTSALLGAGAFLSGWCVLRLVATRTAGFGFDIGLAAFCLALGLATVAYCVRLLHVRRRAAHAQKRRARTLAAPGLQPVKGLWPPRSDD